MRLPEVSAGAALNVGAEIVQTILAVIIPLSRHLSGLAEMALWGLAQSARSAL